MTSRGLPSALAASTALHVGVAVAWYVQQEPGPAAPILTASLRPAAAVVEAVAEPRQAAVPVPAPKSRPPMTDDRRVRLAALTAPAVQAEAAMASEPKPAAAPAAAPAPVVEPPRYDAAYLANPPPTYPVSAKRRGIEGTAMLEALIGTAGEVRDIRLAAGAGDTALDEAALAAVRTWRFLPARRGSEAVEAWVRIPVVFRLN